MTPRERRTLREPAELRGRGLHRGLDTRLRLVPAEAGHGLVFARTDLPGSPRVEASCEHRVPVPRCTALRRGACEVQTVEHLLAALMGLGITDLLIEVDRVEMPGLDGSAAPFVAAIDRAGVRPLGQSVAPLCPARAVRVGEGGASIVCEPDASGLTLSYHLRYGGAVAETTVSFAITEATFREELAPARTFCLAAEALALRAAGLGLGASTENTLVIGEDGCPLENRLRFPDECARHKVLDLMGDLALLGAPLVGRVSADRSGHALNAALCCELAALAASGVGE